MTAYRIHRTATPTRDYGPVLPMEAEQERFWKLLAERKEKKERVA